MPLKNAGSTEKILYSAEEVDQRITELAAEIVRDYTYENPGDSPLFICLMRGGVQFTAKLMFAIAAIAPNFHPEVDYITVRTYGDERTAGSSLLIQDTAPSTVVADRRVLLLDDVFDQGITAAFAIDLMGQKGATEVKIAVLARKQRATDPVMSGDPPPQAHYVGFVTPDVWLTGMGMDNTQVAKEANRWLGDIRSA